MMKVIKMAKDFGRCPGGRFKEHGDFSAEEFRDDLLLPALDDEGEVVVDLDGTMGICASFMEEAFGGLVRKVGPEVMARVHVESNENPGKAERAAFCMLDAFMYANDDSSIRADLGRLRHWATEEDLDPVIRLELARAFNELDEWRRRR